MLTLIPVAGLDIPLDSLSLAFLALPDAAQALLANLDSLGQPTLAERLAVVVKHAFEGTEGCPSTPRLKAYGRRLD